MSNVAQMTVDAFYSQLQSLSAKSRTVKAALEQNRLELMRLWNATRQDPDRQRAARHQAALRPLTHRNSVLRMRHRDLVTKFNAAVRAASSALTQVGIVAPELSGLGIAPALVLVPVVAVAALASAWLIYQSVRTSTEAQRKATAALATVLSDPQLSDEDRRLAIAALAKKTAAEDKGLFDVSGLIPLAGIVALIILGPPLLQAFTSRRASA